jgi:hypothetical protein
MPDGKQFFDVQGARKAGYSDDEIVSHLAESRKFDLEGAKNAGYSTQEILYHLVPNQGLKFTDERSGRTGVVGALKAMIPPDPSGGHPILSKEFWLGEKTPSINPTASGTFYSDVTRPLPSDLPGVQNPFDRATYRGASMLSPMSAEAAEAASAKGDTANVLTQAAVPAALTLAGPLVGRVLPTEGTPIRGGITPLDVAEGIIHPASIPRKLAVGAVKRLFGEKPEPPPVQQTPFPGATSTAKPIGNESLPKVTGQQTPFPKVQTKAEIRAAERLQNKAIDAQKKADVAAQKAATSNPFPNATSSATPIGNAPLPAVPQGSPTPFPVVEQAPRRGAAMAQPPEPSVVTPEEAQDLISRNKRLVKPGEKPTAADLKRAGDYTQIATDQLKRLAQFGDEIARNELVRRQRLGLR